MRSFTVQMPCTNCMAAYSVMRKENGCGNCGYGFCAKCLTKKHLLPRLSNKPVPVCDGCFKSLTGEVVQPLEKSRNEAKVGRDGKWWGDDERPPPSMRMQYPVRPRTAKEKPVEPKHDDEGLLARLATITGRSVDEIKNPRFMVSDKEGDIPTSSTSILNNLRPSATPQLPPTPRMSAADEKLARELNLPAVPPAEDSIEGLEERLAALRNVPVDVIRNPRLMVMDDDSEPELDDDAKKLLEKAEARLRKKEPDLFAYSNEGLDSSDDEADARPHKKSS